MDTCNGISMLLGGINSCVVFLLSWWDREKISKVLRAINEKVRSAKGSADPAISRERLWQFLLLSWIIIISMCTGVIFCFITFLYTYITTDQLMPLWDSPPYSLYWWINIGYSEVVAIFSFANFTLSESQLLDSIFQLAFLYRVEYNKFQAIPPANEGEAKRRFIEIYQELVALKALTDDFLETIRSCKLFIRSVIYLALGNSSVALVVAANEGVVSVVRVILYPAYGLGFLAFGAIFGSHFEESVGYRSKGNN